MAGVSGGGKAVWRMEKAHREAQRGWGEGGAALGESYMQGVSVASQGRVLVVC